MKSEFGAAQQCTCIGERKEAPAKSNVCLDVNLIDIDSRASAVMLLEVVHVPTATGKNGKRETLQAWNHLENTVHTTSFIVFRW